MPQRGEEVRDEEALQRYEGTAAEKILCKSLDFADSVYYQVQFMSGRAIQPFVEQEDAELLQDEPPRVTLKLLCTNMVIRDMVEQKVKQNCNTAFAIIPNRSLSVAEFIFKQVEDIEEELLQELAQSKGEDASAEGNPEGTEGDRLPEEMVLLQQDPSRAVVYQQDVLRWARATRIAGKHLDSIGDGSVVNGGQDIDASKDDSAEAAAAAALRASSSYGRTAERLRPIQRFFALCVVAMTKASLSRMSDNRERLIELMDSLDSYTAQAICEAILELLTLPKNIGLFSKIVPKMMRILSVIRDFLPRFANSKANFSYEIPSFCTNPQTNQLYKPVYRLLPYTASTRLFREICGSISNCCQCLSNLMSDQFPTTNCIPLIQMLAFDEGDGLRDLYDMLRDVEVDIGINDQSLLADLHPDITLMVESLRAITINCNRIMRSRVLEVMYTALHPHGPVLPKKNSKKQDVKELNHDYRILTYLKNSGAEADEKREQFFLPSRIDRAFTFSLWSRMDKGISTQIRIEWDCHSSQESTLDLKRMVEEGLDVLPIDASFRIIRKQQDDHLRLRYEELRELRDANMQKRRRVWQWIDKGGADVPPRPLKDMKELKEQKGWAYMSFILEIEEEDLNKRVTSEREDFEEDNAQSEASAREKAVGDTQAHAKLQVFYGLAKSSKPARPKMLEISKPRYVYHVQDQDIIGAGEFTLTTSSLGEGTPTNDAARANAVSMGSQQMNQDSAASAGDAPSEKQSGNTTPAASVATTSKLRTTTVNMQQQQPPPVNFSDDDFSRIQLETFLPLLMPFKTNAAANAGLLTISPYEVNTPERREAARRAIMMPDVFLSRDLVPELVPCCKVATSTDLLSTLSAHTLYLLTMAFARPEPLHSSEEVDATMKLGQFQQVLEQFRKKCTTGTAEENLGGIRVIVDVLWKLFTRRKKVLDEKQYKSFAQNKESFEKGPYYWVKFVQRILELLTDLCIGPDGNAINEIQDFITRELIQTSEALSIRRRPPPECSDNIWAKTSITVDDHMHARAEIERRTRFVGSGKGLKQLMSQKDEFTLLKLGTSIFFNTFDNALEEAQAPEAEDEDDLAQIIRNMVPRVLWMQQRAQPPRYEGRGYVQEDLDFLQPNQKIQPCRFLYFALVNLLAHLTADRNTDNSVLLQSVIPPSVVRGQLIQREVLRNAGLVFCPAYLAEQRRQQGQVKESRDVADLSDLAALSSHTALLLHGFLRQPPFADESIRSSVISQVYLDGTRADDDDSAFDELPGGGSAPLTPDDLKKLCHMCSWQFASLAELCRDMASPGQPKPRSDFSDCMGHLVSVLSMLLSKLIGLGYFERFRKESEDRQRELQERLEQGAYVNEEDLEQNKLPTFELRWVTELFSAMHRLVQTGEEDDNEDEDAMLVPIYVGAISSKYVGEDNRLTGDRRGHAAEGFFGCDEFGHLYISGHRTDDKFGGFKKGSTVGVEIDYTDEAKRAMFISVDGFRVGAIRREVDEGMVPCVILNGMGQVVRVNVGRPRRGKGLLVKREDTLQDEWQSIYKDHPEPDTTVIHLSYQVGKDQWFTRVKSDEGSKYKEECIYEGWNSAFAVQLKDEQLAKLEKIKAFSRQFQVDSRRVSIWCINVTLTGMFIDSAQIWRSHHLAQQKAWMSFYTDKSGSHHRKVATDWKDAPRDEHDLEDEAVQVITELDAKFCHGAYKLFVCFNAEDPQNFSPEYDKQITIRLKLTPHLPLLGPKNQLIKLFSHFSAVVEQGDGHLIHYKKVELVALQVLQLLKGSERLRNSLLHDSNAEDDSAGYTVFHAAVEFLKSFCECEPHYRALFVKKEVFEFLVSCIALAEQVPVSQMLVSVFANNDMRVNMQFVEELIKAMEENFSKNKQSSLNALLVLTSVVTTFNDNVETRDNGSIIMRRFMENNTEKRIENPYLPMAFEAFRDQVEFMIGDNERIGDHIKQMKQDEAIDERVVYDLSPFFVRDHLLLLFTQVLQAYNLQRTWGKDWFSNYARGGADDQPPNVSEPVFAELVRRHAFELPDKEQEASGVQARGKGAQGEGEEDARLNMTDILEDLFKVLFKQQDWAAEDWGVDQELMLIIKLILSFGLLDAQETAAAKLCLQRLGVGLDQDFQAVEHIQFTDFDHPEQGGGVGLEDDEEGDRRNRKKMVGLHRGFVGQDDEHYTAAFTTMKPSEDFGGRLPDVARLNPSEKRVRQQEHLQDFLYELVEMPDIALAKSLHVDVNLWRRQQIHHATFLLKGSQERVWHVGKEIVQQLKGLSLKLNSGENLLQEFSCEVHVLRPGGGQHIALSIEKGERETRAGHTQWRGHGTAGGGVSNQIYFEVEINGKDVVFLRDMSFDLGRVKVTLQLLGCHTLTLRSRCLFDTHEYQLVVSNPRMTALTTPKAFDPEVVLRAVKVGAKRHANTVRPRPSQEDHNDSLEIKEHAAQKDVEGIGGKKMSMAKKVIHELMPRFTEKVIDLIEDRCFKFERQSKGLDEQLLQATREHEHEFIISVLRQAVSFVMLDVFLEKLEVDNADLLYIQHPNMVEVYEIIQEDSVDQDELDDVPGILKRRIDDGSDSEEGVRELMALEERQLLVQTWIMRLCHAIRTVAFLGIQKMDILSATDGVDDEQDEKQSDDLGLNEGGSAELTRWSSCRAVLNILQELLSRNEEIEEVWARFVASSSECIVNNPNGKLNLTFLTEKATFFCPFSYQQSQSAGSFSFTAAKLKNFFDEAQVPEVDPLMLVSILLYHPQALMRLEAFKLGCRILRDPNVVLQEAYKTHTSADMHLQKAIGFQFCVFEDLYKRDTYTENHIDMMAGMLKLIQQLCEGHLQPLQEFLGADYTVEELDIFSAKTLPGADEEDEHKVAQGRRQDQEEQKNEQPTNIVQWTSQMIHMILESMQEVTLNGREKQYVLVQQLFDTAAELIQGPSMENQATLLENGICADINLLWQNLRRDEGTFRGLIQDNEELFDTWMDLLRVMRSAEIAALKCAMSLLEELQLSEDDNDFAKQQEQVVLHKTTTLARMIQELAPKVLCWKIITHWNLSSEAADPQFEITPNDEDEVGESDKDENEETDEQIVRPKREKACLTYTLDEQYEDCLKVCGLCYSLFHAVFNAPETKTPLFRDVKIEQPVDRVAYTKQDWSVAKTKMFDQFLDKVQKMLGEKYLHFLFGQVEIVRGSRLQRIYFLVPKSIRVLKNHSLIHKWQEECLVAVERSSPEAQIDDFADMVNGQYISFVQKQYDLLGKPWPFNRAGEVIALCINSTMLTTAIINSILVLVYVGSYSEHSITAQDIHYPNHLSVYALTGFAAVHFSLSVLWLGFYILSYSGWIIETKVDEWREEHPQLQSQLNSTLFRLSLQAKIFFSDGQLMYTLFLLVFSFLGLFVSFLFNAVNTIDLCMRIPILAKVIESITVSRDQVAGTMVLGFCIQYMAVGAGFLLFSQGYGFADKDTSACSTLMECLRAHFDYGFRSAPVWSGPKLTYTRFTFDYVYNLVIILIMAAIISGIIIDTFADLREEQKTIQDKMKSSCFICSLSKSELERKRVKFENHILKDHYMWAYARFLLYLDETDPAELNGPESYEPRPGTSKAEESVTAAKGKGKGKGKEEPKELLDTCHLCLCISSLISLVAGGYWYSNT
eukprot:g23922.t1